MHNFFYKFKYLDLTLAVTCFLLLLIGIALIYSTTLNGGQNLFYRQVIYGLGAIALFLFFSYFDYRNLSKVSRYLYIVFVVLLIAVLELGPLIKGSTRWFDLKVFNFQ